MAAFQTNFYIEARAERQVHKEGGCCGVCEQQATQSCRECEILLCESCTRCHQTLPSTRSHMVINLCESDEGKPLLSKQRFCEKHRDKKLRFYCVPCERVVCRDCKLTSHEGHKTKDIADIVNQAKTSLTKTKVKLEKYKKQLYETYQENSYTSNEISNDIERTQKEIEHFSKSLMKPLENVIKKLNNLKEEHKNTFSKESHSLIEKQIFLQGQIDHICATLKEGLECDVISIDSQMKQRLAEIEKSHLVASEFDSALSTVPHIQHVSSARIEAIQCFINDIVRVVVPSHGAHILNYIRKISFTRKRIHSLSFSGTQNAWLTLGTDSLELCLFEIDKTKKRKIRNTPVTMEHLQKHGIRGCIERCNKRADPTSATNEAVDELKKGFLCEDINANGDACKVDQQYNAVLIKPVRGHARLVTFNPFVESDHEFTPVDVCWANDREILILDDGSKLISVYDVREGFQKAYSSRLLYTNLTAIAVDSNGQIWVGNDQGTVYIFSTE